MARDLIYESQSAPSTAVFHIWKRHVPSFCLLVEFPSNYFGLLQGAAKLSCELQTSVTKRSDPLQYIFPVPSFSTPLLQFSLHRTVSMDQLEPDNQVVALLPVEPSLEQGLTADGKRQLHLFSRWFQVCLR